MQPGKNNSGAVIRVRAVTALGDGPNEGFSFFLIELSSGELLLAEEETRSHSGRWLGQSRLSGESEPVGCVGICSGHTESPAHRPGVNNELCVCCGGCLGGGGRGSVTVLLGHVPCLCLSDRTQALLGGASFPELEGSPSFVGVEEHSRPWDTGDLTGLWEP